MTITPDFIFPRIAIVHLEILDDLEDSSKLEVRNEEYY